jgi:Holliday junction resolvase-like predicted endonuclease
VALLAEELVEEWLNRQGYFTIRGVKIGVDEIDILATKHHDGGEVEYRHVEVQASMRPVSYISKVPKEIQKQGKAANSAARTNDELIVGVREWVEKKYRKPKKVKLIESLAPPQWSSELVINNVKSQEEVKLIEAHGIKIIHLSTVLRELKDNAFMIQSAAGADFVDLVNMGANEIA